MDRTGTAGERAGQAAVLRYIAEFLGTALLVFAGVGSAIFARNTGGVIVVGLTFGLVMLILYYALGPVSGAHLNPAVTLGTVLSRKISLAGAVGYWIAQVLGAVLAAFVLWLLVRQGGVFDETGVLGANEFGPNINAGGTVVLEFVLTFLFVFVVLLVTSRTEQAAIRGVAIGLALGLANLVAIPLDGASINPARSIGPAIFNGGASLEQLWLFIVVPLLGAVAAAFVAPLFAHAHEPGRERRGVEGGRSRDWQSLDDRTAATEVAETKQALRSAARQAGKRPNRR